MIVKTFALAVLVLAAVGEAHYEGGKSGRCKKGQYKYKCPEYANKMCAKSATGCGGCQAGYHAIDKVFIKVADDGTVADYATHKTKLVNYICAKIDQPTTRPTKKPTTKAPTSKPTKLPTVLCKTKAPTTGTPTTGTPTTKAPTTKAPTSKPTTAQPTTAQPTTAPTPSLTKRTPPPASGNLTCTIEGDPYVTSFSGSLFQVVDQKNNSWFTIYNMPNRLLAVGDLVL
jgi:hypothetical protein